MKRLLAIASICVLLLPVAALAIPNPLRIYLPELYGLTCDAARLCVEDREQFVPAQALAEPAMADMGGGKLGVLDRPMFVFAVRRIATTGSDADPPRRFPLRVGPYLSARAAGRRTMSGTS